MIWKSIAPVAGCSGGSVRQLGGSTWGVYEYMDAMGYTKKNHRNSQKDLDPRPGVPNEYKLGQLLGKGAALSGRGPNPWERGKGKGR